MEPIWILVRGLSFCMLQWCFSIETPKWQGVWATSWSDHARGQVSDICQLHSPFSRWHGSILEYASIVKSIYLFVLMWYRAFSTQTHYSTWASLLNFCPAILCLLASVSLSHILFLSFLLVIINTVLAFASGSLRAAFPLAWNCECACQSHGLGPAWWTLTRKFVIFPESKIIAIWFAILKTWLNDGGNMMMQQSLATRLRNQ